MHEYDAAVVSFDPAVDISGLPTVYKLCGSYSCLSAVVRNPPGPASMIKKGRAKRVDQKGHAGELQVNL